METHQKVVRDAILDTDRLRVWYMKVARHRGTTTAIMATVGELLTIAYRLLTDTDGVPLVVGKLACGRRHRGRSGPCRLVKRSGHKGL